MASVLPRPGPARDPAGVALAAPIPHGPRAGQRLGLTDELVTRRRRRNVCLGEADAAVHSNPTLRQCGRTIPATQETRIRLPRNDAQYHHPARHSVTSRAAPRTDHQVTGPGQCSRAPTAPEGPNTGNLTQAPRSGTRSQQPQPFPRRVPPGQPRTVTDQLRPRAGRRKPEPATRGPGTRSPRHTSQSTNHQTYQPWSSSRIQHTPSYVPNDSATQLAGPGLGFQT
jgi:hypothetical protein